MSDVNASTATTEIPTSDLRCGDARLKAGHFYMWPKKSRGLRPGSSRRPRR